MSRDRMQLSLIVLTVRFVSLEQGQGSVCPALESIHVTIIQQSGSGEWTIRLP
jgi:hypothetical protein